MDIVFIKELCIETVIGIYDWERKIKQFVCIDLELGTDISDASNSDVINDTVFVFSIITFGSAIVINAICVWVLCCIYRCLIIMNGLMGMKNALVL